MSGLNNNNYFGLAKNGRKFYKDNRKFFYKKRNMLEIEGVKMYMNYCFINMIC